jgi:hypothetical protein
VAALHDIFRTSGYDKQILCFRNVGTTEDGRAHIALTVLSMLRGKAPREARADGAGGTVDRSGLQSGQDAAVAEDDFLDSGVIGKHRHGRFAIADRIRRRVGDCCAFFGESFGFGARSVVHGKLMAGTKEISRDRGAHSAESNESDLHSDIRWDARHQGAQKEKQ